MMGYYKNDEATAQAIDKDGWLHTGDLGTIDDKGNLFIRGRSKAMILSSSGQNIYPEEIEDKVNNQPGVSESVVVSRQGHLVALVYPDKAILKQPAYSKLTIDQLMDNNLVELNRQLPPYSQIAKIELVAEEFEKTPKRSIKRFMYK